MKILLWKFSQNHREEKNTLFTKKYCQPVYDLTSFNYSDYIPDIDLNFYKIYIYEDTNYRYIVLDIYQVSYNMPNKSYIYPLIKLVYENQLKKSNDLILKEQKYIYENIEYFENKKHNDLYIHQIYNISWMKDIERLRPIETIKKNYIMITENIGINILTFEMKYKKDIIEYINIPGGCLLDDYGMGKTKCMIKLCEETKSNESIDPFDLNATLIICHHDLCLKWQDEILECNPDANIKILATPNDYGSFENMDYVILSYKFFNDYHKKNYQDYNYSNNYFDSIKFMKDHVRNTNKEIYQVTNYKWRRLIIDDIHEIFRLKQNDYFLNSIHKIDAKIKWGMTGNEIFHTDATLNILKYIMGTNDIFDIIRNPLIMSQIKQHFRKTLFKKTNISFKYLDFNPIEQNCYLKQRTHLDKQEYCLFPKINNYPINTICNIIKDTNNDSYAFLQQNLETIENRNCDICFTDIKLGDLSITKCGHHGCYECLIKSQEITRKCPFCRNRLYINDIYLVNDGIHDPFYGPKIKQLLFDLKLNIKTIVYLENYHINKLSTILDNNNINYKILKGSMRYKYNLIKQFEKENFVLIISDQLVNYGIKGIERVIILENWFKDTENKLKRIAKHVGYFGFTYIVQYLINNTFEVI